MKISKTTTKNINAVIAFDSIIESLFEYKNININDFAKDRILLVSFNNEIGADYNFDYNLFCQGAIGQLVIIKSLSNKIFGESVDPRLIIDFVNKKINCKKQNDKIESSENNNKILKEKFSNIFKK